MMPHPKLVKLCYDASDVRGINASPGVLCELLEISVRRLKKVWFTYFCGGECEGV